MQKSVGAIYQPPQCYFSVWAPKAQSVKVKVVAPFEKTIPLEQDISGYWTAQIEDIPEGVRYYYQLNNELERPDPASLAQPEGVHGPSEVVNLNSFAWTDAGWQGLSMEEMIMYELHVGTFTPKGTFEAIIERLDYLLELGINTIELMPISQFPGDRNWGYDGVYPFAPQLSYGGVAGLQRLVEACHQKGIAVVLDVVYNHMGPEGNYLSDFGPYFTDKYHTPWGSALNFDDAYCDGVRNFFIQNALMWLRDFHIDGLRLDAIHAIKDLGAKHFLHELSESVDALAKENNRQYVLIGECDLNDPKYINPYEKGGYGLSGQWIDEFHHAIHSLVTGEKNGYYADFGEFHHLVKAFEKTYVYDGIYSPHRKRTFGGSAEDNPFSQFVVFSQNHDQIGNRMLGERLSSLVSFEALKLIAGCVVLSPYVPMLYMGEEYGEENPFLYFVSHTDPSLVKAVREGRKREFAAFHGGEQAPPDPQSEDTFQASKLSWDIQKEKHTTLFNFYKQLIHIRKNQPAIQNFNRDSQKVHTGDPKLIVLYRQAANKDQPQCICIINFDTSPASFAINTGGKTYQKILDSSEEKWKGAGTDAPLSLEKENNSGKIMPETFMVYQET